MICFCMSGTSSNGSSTPRSPRATMIASAASRIPQRLPEGGVLFDLRDQLGAAGDERPQLFDVLGPAHERERDVVHAPLDGALYVFQVLFRERRRAHLDAGEVHPLVRPELPAVVYSRAHAGGPICPPPRGRAVRRRGGSAPRPARRRRDHRRSWESHPPWPRPRARR